MNSTRRPALDLVLVNIASQCNLNCSYCYVYNMGHNHLHGQPKFITDQTVINLTNQLESLSRIYDGTFSVALHGGEPMLAGYDRLKFILDNFNKAVPGSISIQTNATLITNKILDLLLDYKISIGVSLDGPQMVNDIARRYRSGKSSYSKTIEGLNKIINHPISKDLFSIIIGVVTPESDPVQCYNFLSEFSPTKIDFLFRDGYYGCLPEGKRDLESTEYGEWLTRLAQYYLPLENAIPIRKIDSLVSGYIKEKTSKAKQEAFGMLAINPDGSITKNELYDIVPMSTRFSRPWNINKDSIIELIMSREYHDYTHDNIPSSPICQSCEYLDICGGGQMTHTRWSKENGIDNPSIFCSDYKYFLKEIGNFLDEKILAFGTQ